MLNVEALITDERDQVNASVPVRPRTQGNLEFNRVVPELRRRVRLRHVDLDSGLKTAHPTLALMIVFMFGEISESQGSQV